MVEGGQPRLLYSQLGRQLGKLALLLPLLCLLTKLQLPPSVTCQKSRSSCIHTGVIKMLLHEHFYEFMIVCLLSA